VADTCGTLSENVIANMRQHGPQFLRFARQSSVENFFLTSKINLGLPSNWRGLLANPVLVEAYSADTCGTRTSNVITNEQDSL